jgi:hypothetical protein
VKTKVAKSQTKTTNTFAGKKCVGAELPPTIAFETATAVNDAGELQVVEGTTAVFGNPPVIVAKGTDKPGAACQAEVVKQFNAIANKWMQEANKAKKTAIKGGKNNTPPAVLTDAELGAAIDTALTGNVKVGKAVTKSDSGIAKKCTDAQVDTLFDCGGATTLTALQDCVETASQQAACEAFELGDGIPLTCPALVVVP